MARGTRKDVAGFTFGGYGAHHDAYPHHYLTAAAALGSKKEEIDRFIHKLKSVYVAARKNKDV